MADVEQFEESLRPRFRQPRAAEQLGIEPVPPELRTTRWPDLFTIVFNFLVNPGMILIGGLAVAAGLSFWGTSSRSFSGSPWPSSPTWSWPPSASTMACRARSVPG